MVLPEASPQAFTSSFNAVVLLLSYLPNFTTPKYDKIVWNTFYTHIQKHTSVGASLCLCRDICDCILIVETGLCCCLGRIFLMFPIPSRQCTFLWDMFSCYICVWVCLLKGVCNFLFPWWWKQIKAADETCWIFFFCCCCYGEECVFLCKTSSLLHSRKCFWQLQSPGGRNRTPTQVAAQKQSAMGFFI